jgi:hypothetical protein
MNNIALLVATPNPLSWMMRGQSRYGRNTINISWLRIRAAHTSPVNTGKYLGIFARERAKIMHSVEMSVNSKSSFRNPAWESSIGKSMKAGEKTSIALMGLKELPIDRRHAFVTNAKYKSISTITTRISIRMPSSEDTPKKISPANPRRTKPP